MFSVHLSRVPAGRLPAGNATAHWDEECTVAETTLETRGTIDPSMSMGMSNKVAARSGMLSVEEIHAEKDITA